MRAIAASATATKFARSTHPTTPRISLAKCQKRPPARPTLATPQDLPDLPLSRQEGQAHRSPRCPPNHAQRKSGALGGWVRGESMRPRESEGTAEGGDEDDDGAVRSEGSGPRSLTRAPSPPTRRTPSAPTPQQRQIKQRSAPPPRHDKPPRTPPPTEPRAPPPGTDHWHADNADETCTLTADSTDSALPRPPRCAACLPR